MAEIPITLSTGEKLEGGEPVVFIGSNGSGKTSHSARVQAEHPRIRIAASRQMQPPVRVGPEAQDQQQELVHARERQLQYLHQGGNNFLPLMAAIVLDDQNQRLELLKGLQPGDPLTGSMPETKRHQIENLWKSMMPGRSVDFSADPFRVVSGQENPYGIQLMSDGEKAVLYAGLEVIMAPDSSVIIVDEPERHIHPLLASELWDRLQEMRSDCRFVYATHDFRFAASRSSARYIICRDRNTCNLVPAGAPLPGNLVPELIGAASFVRHGGRLVFCEGGPGGLDDRVYSAFYGSDATVVPVGGADDVLACVRALRDASFVAGAAIFGIVDRDFRCDDEIQKLKEGHVHVLQLHELESVLAAEPVVRAVARYLPGAPKEPDYASEFAKVLSHLGNRAHLTALERAQDRVIFNLRQALGHPEKANEIVAKGSFVEAVGLACGAPDDVFNSEIERLRAAGGNASEVLPLFPGKDFKSMVRQLLRLSTWEAVVDAVVFILHGHCGDDARQGLKLALTPYLHDLKQPDSSPGA